MKLGKHKLRVEKILRNKIILTDGKEEIQAKEYSKNLKEGDKIDVFVYDGPDGNRIATEKMPIIDVNGIGNLKVVAKTKFGYFVDIGLDKDIFLPYQEKKGRIEVGEHYLMTLYIDKSNRFCVSMNIKEKLKKNEKYKSNDLVKGVIYDIDHRGAMVAVDGIYDGMIPKEELKGIYKIGDEVNARVQRVLKNDLITLTIRQKSYKQMDKDADDIEKLLKENNGKLEIGDKSDSEKIKAMTGLSKRAFKRACGALYKQEKVKLFPERIELRK